MSRRIKLFPIQILAIGFAFIILIGALLLMMPVCSKDNNSIAFIDALFTTTSATCVTGLAVFDTYSQFTIIGQIIILLLIQIGGLGFMCVAMTFFFLMGSKITIFQRYILMESMGSLHMSGVVRTIRHALFGTFTIEGIGAIIISTQFIPSLGFAKGLWFGIFHSVSAFCNAGFDLIGISSPGTSLCTYYDNPVILITIMLLIMTGGIGFIVWDDIIKHKRNFRKYALHSKIMISFTIMAIFGGAIAFYIIEGNHVFADMTTGEKILNSFFASVSPRTAGFASIDYSEMSTAGRFVTMFLMMIGAGPGSTGGGIKLTTFAVLLLAMYSYSKNYNDLSIFKRRIPREARNKAFANTFFYLSLVLLCTFCLQLANPGFTAESCLFESFSAMGTVGLSTGITGSIGSFSKFCLITLMYCGRLGSIAVAMAIVRRKIIPKVSYPEEKITIG